MLPEQRQAIHTLLPLTIAGGVGAMGFIAAATSPVTTSLIVGQLVAGLAVNYASEYVPGLLTAMRPSLVADPWSDIERVAKLSLLTILFETLSSQGWSSADINKLVKQVGETLDGRLFQPEALTEPAILASIGRPRPLTKEQGRQIARHILTGYPVVWDKYGRALSERFTTTYSSLLSHDPQAHRAATTFLQQQHLRELKEVSQEVRAVVDKLIRPQPRLVRFEQLALVPGSPVRQTDLQFRRRSTPFLGRERELQRVLGSLNSTEPLRILKVLGAAGSGKSRMALELCDALHFKHWLAGFVTRDAPWPSPWCPIRDSFVVLDLADARVLGGVPLISWLKQLLLDVVPSGLRVRVMLLDRSDEGGVWMDWRRDELAGDLDAITDDTIALSADRGLFDEIVRAEFRRRRGRLPNYEESRVIEEIRERLQEDEHRPLFGLLTASTVAEDASQRQSWSPEILVEAFLKGQLAAWQSAGVCDDDLDLLVESTVIGEVPSSRTSGLSSSIFASLRSLSAVPESGAGLGPIVPDFIGEFFVLMRIRGEAVIGDRQPAETAARTRKQLTDLLFHPSAADFFRRLLQDYLLWTPATGENPAIGIAEVALELPRRLGVHAPMVVVAECASSVAFKQPFSRPWHEWILSIPESARPHALAHVAAGLRYATTSDHDPARRSRLVDAIETLHELFGHDATVRVQLAMALDHVTVVHPDAGARLAAAERLARLHERFGHEAAVREQLARALCETSVIESDTVATRALVDRLDALHRQFGAEAVVREQLARTIKNLTFDEPDAERRHALIDRLNTLHETFGHHEPAVREELVRALAIDAGAAPSAQTWMDAAARLNDLHEMYGFEPQTRAPLATALYYAAVHEPSLEQRRALAERLRVLHDAYGQEANVRAAWALVLVLLTDADSDPRRIEAVAERLRQLHEGYGFEHPVRRALAHVLSQVAAIEPEAPRRRAIVDQVAALYEHDHDPDVRAALAAVLWSASEVEPDVAGRLALAERLESLHELSPDVRVREALANVLYNAALVEPDAVRQKRIVRRIVRLRDVYGPEDAIMAALMKIGRRMSAPLEGDIPGPSAKIDADEAARQNNDYQRRLVEWRALPWRKRRKQPKPEPPTGI